MIRSTFRVRPMVSIDRSVDADSNGPGMMIQQLQYSAATASRFARDNPTSRCRLRCNPSSFLAPGPEVVDNGVDAGLNSSRGGQIPLEGGLRTGRLALSIGDDRPVVFAVRDPEITGGGFAELMLQKGRRLPSQIRPRLDAEPLHSCRYDGAEAVEFCDWRRGRPETGSVSHGGTTGGW